MLLQHAQFLRFQEKNPFTAYEFNRDVYYSVVYAGVFDESDLISRGLTKEDLS